MYQDNNEGLDENELKINEDLDKHDRESGSDECDVDID